MDADWLDRYARAWACHPQAGAPTGGDELQALLDFYAPDASYEDVPTGFVFSGHDGLRQMCEGSHQWSSDLEIEILSYQVDGSLFAIEGEVSGTNTSPVGELPATGRPFVLRGASIGRTDGRGLVVEHRDYWDLATYLRQIGVLPASM